VRLDQTQVTIRARGILEQLDLALKVLRRFPGIWVASFLGIVPLLLLDLAIIGWMPGIEGRVFDERESNISGNTRYFLMWVCLAYLQIPLASVPVTIFLGQAIFEQVPSWRDVAATLRQNFLRSVVMLGIFQCGLALPAILATIPRTSRYCWPQEFLIPGAMMFVVGMWRMLQPYLPEVLVLEQCPIRKRAGKISLFRRNRFLHAGSSGELIVRHILISLVIACLWFSLLQGFYWARSLLFGNFDFDRVFYWVLLPASFWLTAVMAFVVRFLGYLDLRIRQEGWEVELLARAEAIRMNDSGMPTLQGGRS
jgi:hypothetical protein